MCLSAKIDFELAVKPNLEFFRRQTEVQLDSVDNNSTCLGNSLKILVLSEPRDLLHLLIELACKRIEVGSC